MKTLEQKDIAAFLPYGLEVKFIDENKTKKGRIIACGYVCNSETETVHVFCDNDNEIYDLYLFQIRPYFRPFSQFHQEIVHEGYNDNRPFIPILELAKRHENCNWEINDDECVLGDTNFYFSNGFYSNTKRECLIEESDGWSGYKTYDNSISNQLELYQLLYQWHFWLGDQSYFEQGVILEKGRGV